jgi:hypothetical protein
MCIILDGYVDGVDWIYKYKSIMHVNKERQINFC